MSTKDITVSTSVQGAQVVTVSTSGLLLMGKLHHQWMVFSGAAAQVFRCTPRLSAHGPSRHITASFSRYAYAGRLTQIPHAQDQSSPAGRKRQVAVSPSRKGCCRCSTQIRRAAGGFRGTALAREASQGQHRASGGVEGTEAAGLRCEAPRVARSCPGPRHGQGREGMGP